MTPEQFMHALAEFVAEAEDAGLPTEVVATSWSPWPRRSGRGKSKRVLGPSAAAQRCRRSRSTLLTRLPA